MVGQFGNSCFFHEGQEHEIQVYYRPKRYCPLLVAQEGSALWGNTLTTALLDGQNPTIPFGPITLLTILTLRLNFVIQRLVGGHSIAPKTISANAASASP